MNVNLNPKTAASVWTNSTDIKKPSNNNKKTFGIAKVKKKSLTQKIYGGSTDQNILLFHFHSNHNLHEAVSLLHKHLENFRRQIASCNVTSRCYGEFYIQILLAQNTFKVLARMFIGTLYWKAEPTSAHVPNYSKDNYLYWKLFSRQLTSILFILSKTEKPG